MDWNPLGTVFPHANSISKMEFCSGTHSLSSQYVDFASISVYQGRIIAKVCNKDANRRQSKWWKRTDFSAHSQACWLMFWCMIEDSSWKQLVAWAVVCGPSWVQREGRKRSHIKCTHSILLRMIAPSIQLFNTLGYIHPEVKWRHFHLQMGIFKCTKLTLREKCL